MGIEWKVPDDTYLDFLRDNYERRIPFSDYGDDKHKPFFGSLFEIDEMVYISQVSHPQDRHRTMTQQLDFYKIYHPDDNRLIAVVNLNYMFPIHKSLLINLQYKNIDQYRTFKSIEEKSKYIDLLSNELKQINNLPLITNSKRIYLLKYEHPDAKVSLRSFDFKKLEQGCNEFINKQALLNRMTKENLEETGATSENE
jgi:protein AbiQ